ncbi:MAG: hypothetical protein WAV47_17395, partial [Blastocatellia bacterium]
MLHIHNGDSTANTLKEFDFPGDHIAFQEVLMAGPTPSGLSAAAWQEVRAKFLSEEYELRVEECQKRLVEQDAALRSFSEHEETIFWFEHDLFCQIHLIYLLDWFSTQSLGKTRLSLICIDGFPGIEDFRGLGQLTGGQLASLFDTRHEVTDLEMNTARRAWAAYCAANPEGIPGLLGEDASPMPFLRSPMRLHLSRFPSVKNGLGRIENCALEMISNGAIGFKELFPKFAKSEPLFGIGDLQLWCEMNRLAKAREPLITISGIRRDQPETMSNRSHEASFELTATGRSILAGEADFVDINGLDLWLGGVHLVDGIV